MNPALQKATILAAASLLFASAGCAQSVSQPAADPAPTAVPATSGAPASAGSSASGNSAATVSPDYVIGPGDALEVFVWRNPELSTKVPVRPDGKISTPLVEDMVAVGKTPAQLARDIEKVLAEYIRSPQVNIIVSSATSAMSQVRVVGEVQRPQAVPFREGLTVLDLVLAVGGLGEFAAGNRAKIVRNVDGKSTELPVRLHDLVNKGRMQYNLALRPGDVLVVPQAFF